MVIRCLVNIFLILSLVSCSHMSEKRRIPASSKKLPAQGWTIKEAHWQKIVKLIEKNEFWRTSVIIDNPSLDGWTVESNKKWRYYPSSKSLEEISRLSIIKIDDKEIWGKAVLNLRTPDISQLLFAEPLSSVNITKIEIYTEDTFSIHLSNKKVVVFSSDENQGVATPTQGTKFNHMTAPITLDPSALGINMKNLWPDEKLSPTTEVRQDLKSNRQVYIDKNFPLDYRVSVKQALSEWNKNLRKNYYQLVQEDVELNPFECYAQRNRLCIFWNGSHVLPWSGIMGLSAITIDPIQGFIRGGAIYVKNLNKSKNLPHLPRDVIDNLNDLEKRIGFAAHIWSNRKQYKDYLNPNPVRFLKALLVHELGHDNGYRHYFSGSLHAKDGRISDTVMDYPPFPLFHLNDSLGPRDILKIGSLYFNQNFGNGLFHEESCTDKDVLVSPKCMPNDIGDNLNFLIAIAMSSKENIFKKINPVGGILLLTEMFRDPFPVAQYLLSYLSPHRKAISNYEAYIARHVLCKYTDRDRLQEYIRKNNPQTKLNCEILD